MSDTTLGPTRPSDKDQRAAIRELTAALPPEIRRLRRTVLAATLADGVPVDPSSLTVVLAAHLAAVHVPLEFTSEHVTELLWFRIIRFCDDHGIVPPSGCARSLHALLATLVSTGHLAGTTSAAPLFVPFDELAGSAATG